MPVRKHAKFINNDEARTHFDKLASFDVKRYRDRMHAKVWPGFVMAVFNMALGTPTICGSLRIIGMEVGDYGGAVRLLHQATGAVCRVGHVPMKLFNFDVACSIPQQIKIERTIKVIEETGQPLYNLAMLIEFRHRFPPLLMPPDMERVASWDEMRRMFPSDQAYRAEYKRYLEATMESALQAQHFGSRGGF